MDLGLKGKVALVTAASKGIGKAIAAGLAAEGCEISICSRTKEDLLNCASDIKKLKELNVNIMNALKIIK